MTYSFESLVNSCSSYILSRQTEQFKSGDNPNLGQVITVGRGWELQCLGVLCERGVAGHALPAAMAGQAISCYARGSSDRVVDGSRSGPLLSRVVVCRSR